MEAETLTDGALVESFGPLSQVRGSPVGFQLDFEWDYDEYATQISSLLTLHKFEHFALGDLLKYGDRYTDKQQARERERLLAAGYSEALLTKCEWVAKSIPLAHRSRAVSFEHHVALARRKGAVGCSQHQGGYQDDCEPCEEARLADIDGWLDKAAKKKWTTDDLKNAMQEERDNQRVERAVATSTAASDNGEVTPRKPKGRKRAKDTEEASAAADAKPEPFDPANLFDCAKRVADRMTVLRKRLPQRCLVTAKGKPDLRGLKKAKDATADLLANLEDFESAIVGAESSSKALAK